MTKYISFSPYYSGFSNIVMNYECAFAVAYITGRTLILPPNAWCLFISKSHNPEDYIDIWEVFNKDYVMSEFDCVDFYNVPEFKGKYLMMSGHGDKNVKYQSYTNYIDKSVSGVKNIDLLQYEGSDGIVNTLCSSKQVITNDDYEDDLDFEDFRQDRIPLNLSKFEDQILHFENSLFGHYWYSIYPGNEDERNKMKNKINKCFRYNDRIYDIAFKVSKTLGVYNAIHVRRSDFLDTQTKSLEPVSNPEKLKCMVELFFERDVPLYISTDENDKSFFDELGKIYNIFFYEDFEYQLNSLDKVAVEQTICSQAKTFYGTFNSTFTTRINVMRGLEGKQSEDDMGINYYPFENRQDVVTANPWKLNHHKIWEWNNSSHPQWKTEKDGKYI
jgi:hypothetical protein